MRHHMKSALATIAAIVLMSPAMAQPVQSPDDATIADAYVYLLGRALVDRQEKTDMAEAGVDISQSRSKHVRDLGSLDFDYVITVCDNARETCPVFQGPARTVHRSFDDPPFLARGAVSEDEALSHYRRVRDEIRAFVETLPEALLGARK